MNPYGWFRWVFDALVKLPADARLLELGCGHGLLWKENIDRIPAGWHITLSDLSPGMLDAALSTWLDVLQPDERNEALRALGQRLGRDAPAKGASFARRLASVAEQLSRLHYDAHWEAGAEGPRMILGRCPYAAIIERHPELCQADAAMLGALLESGVEQRSKLQPVCIFLVTP